jgi:hypothetical protein
MGLQAAFDNVRPNDSIMYRNGRITMHFQFERPDRPHPNGVRVTAWYRQVDDAGQEELGFSLYEGYEDRLAKEIEQHEGDLRALGMDPDQYRIIPIPPDWEQRTADLYGPHS